MEVQITTGAAQLLLGAILPLLGGIRWAKTPHREAHKALRESSLLMERQMSTIYDYFIPQAIKERETRDTPG